MTRPKFAIMTGVICTLIHTIALVAFGVYVAKGMRVSPEAEISWVLWMCIDFPISLLAILLEVLVVPMLESIGIGIKKSTLFFPITFGLLGGIQYFVLGYWIGKKRHDRKLKNGKVGGA